MSWAASQEVVVPGCYGGEALGPVMGGGGRETGSGVAGFSGAGVALLEEELAEGWVGKCGVELSVDEAGSDEILRGEVLEYQQEDVVG